MEANGNCQQAFFSHKLTNKTLRSSYLYKIKIQTTKWRRKLELAEQRKRQQETQRNEGELETDRDSETVKAGMVQRERKERETESYNGPARKQTWKTGRGALAFTDLESRFLKIDFRGGGGEREEKQRVFVPLTYLFIGCFLCVT